ncbi:MAG TPA: DUF4105 domain-containing protein, partial [Gammaproteobacteria bacterium]
MSSFFYLQLRLIELLITGFTVCILCGYAYGQPKDKTYDQLISLVDQRTIYLDRQWLALLHYRQENSGLWSSEADNSAFFLSPQGRNSPRDELIALINNIFKKSGDEKLTVFCRFPARSHWVINRLDIRNITIPSCVELESWKSRFSMDDVSILFASSYIGNPASMFGHTFLLFTEKDKGKDQSLISMTVNYVANGQEADGYFQYIVKGLTGGFTGVIENQPLFVHLRRYVENEGRDLWQYHLKFSREEIELIVMHIWEIRENFFDYYYIDENCSYRILAILSVARPTLFNHKDFASLTMPVDTIRNLSTQSMIDKIEYWPSSMKQFAAHATLLPTDEQDLAYRLAHGLISPDNIRLQSLGEERRAAVLSLAMEYTGLLIQRNDTGSIEKEKLVFNIIKARADIDTKFIPPPYSADPTDPTLGHKTRRLLFTGGHAGRHDYFEFGFRPVGHDFLDPIQGQITGAQTEFMNFNYRFYADEERLEKLELLHIASYTPITKFFHFKSLDFNVSRERKLLNDEFLLLSTVGGSIGYSILANKQLYSALTTLSIDHNDIFKDDSELVAGIKISALGQFTDFSYQASYSHEDHIHDKKAGVRR